MAIGRALLYAKGQQLSNIHEDSPRR